MAGPPSYEIRSVHDFARVPRDRRDTCLREFRIWLELVDAVQEMMLFKPLKSFIWIDDDKHEATIGISAGGQDIPIASGIMKGFGDG